TCDLPSISIALDFTHRRLTSGRRLTVILSDIDSDGADLATIYREAGETLRLRGVSRLIGIGEEISRHFAETALPGSHYPSTEAFLQAVTPTDFSSELILIKGSPAFGFDKIVNHLEAKTHETVLEVNLDAMVDNFNFFRSKLKPATGIVAMVKASGYGAGSLELAKTLQAHGAAYLAVAVGDEGAELRKAGITMPIMVLNPMVLNYTQLFDNRLEPEIFSFESLDQIIFEARRAGVSGYPIHIKLDSGMHRLGFREEELPRLLQLLDSQTEVTVKSVFSHLATADCLDQDDYTRRQLDYYTRCADLIVNHFPHKVLRHVLNTAGILRFPQYQFDMVRLGIGLYGIPVLNNGTESPLRPISSLRSVVIALRRWEQTETVGYGRRGVLSRPSLIATVPIGYADGFNRHCGRGNWKVAVNGHLCPTVGNICMDTCMVDVTDVPDVRTGDPVVIFGPENPATEMARVLDTIPYECLTSVSPRVRRVYFRES
ncbi:MAG: alanine racemase, partial [Muribaculaceae bacterium]|nr:alanine racemase [Muribaculaceae bacterium]